MITWLGLALALVGGASVGSFVNLAADRIPAGASLVRPRSHCGACGRPLSAPDLVPVLSYVALRGRCRRCGTRLSPRDPVVEAALGLVAAYLWWDRGPTVATLVLFVFVALLVLVSVIDREHRLVPRVLVGPGAGVALLLAPWWAVLGLERGLAGSGSPLYVFLGSLAGAALVGGALAVVAAVYPGGMGWGDPELGVLVGLVSGIPAGVVALLVAVVSGGVVAAALLALRLRGRRDAMPFAPYLGLGGVVAALWGGEVWSWYVALIAG